MRDGGHRWSAWVPLTPATAVPMAFTATSAIGRLSEYAPGQRDAVKAFVLERGESGPQPSPIEQG